MEIITRQSKANKASFNYKAILGSKDGKYTELQSLGSNPDPDDVDRVIGNNYWTSLTCDECRSNVEVVIRVGEEPDYESNTAYICLPCISKLGKMATQYKREQKAKLKENE